MIEVQSISKKFGSFNAIDNISFNIQANNIVGLLGPNGAGKTTIMRLLSGYLKADSGIIKVSGFDVLKDAPEVKKRIGYLPENCPLYTDMRVDEFLKYRAIIKGVLPRRVITRILKVKEQCGIGDIGSRIIGTLSKGFCQRVGLADVLIHEPEILILDEPTVGLDPSQIIEIRNLLYELSNSHTILISTHIMQEAEALCDHVIMINQGKLVISDSKYNLCNNEKKHSSYYVEIKTTRDDLNKNFNILLLEVINISNLENEWLAVNFKDKDSNSNEYIFSKLNNLKLPIRIFREKKDSMEDIFIRLINERRKK